MKRLHSLGLLCVLFMTTLLCLGCKPEIAVVLDDYCNFHKDCGYNTITYYEHSYSACDRFHKDLLEHTAEGKSSGCHDDVEHFFIDFMHAQMELGCDATLMQSLNASEETRNQLSTMLTCIQENSNDITEDDVADMGLHIVEQLDLDINHMEENTCTVLIGTILKDEEKLKMICAMDLSKMDVDTCNSLFEGLESAGLFSFGSVDFRQRVCALFTHADPV